ncbi:restriction endonuclease [Enterobacter asburiae]|uniref:restriction endonuclease n=1 Tax=Enterobacter asburiae TaxID=61645 RepID=UPI00385599F7
MADSFHYSSDIVQLLINTIPVLCRSKRDVVLFFQGAGVESADMAEMVAIVRNNPNSISKFDIARDLITKINTRGDSGLKVRREIIKRVVEFDNFEHCWENDQYKAKGLVASIREAVNKKDAFTRMKQERDAERSERVSQQQIERSLAAEKRKKLEAINQRLSVLFMMDDKPQERGKLLEGVLNDLFRAYGILVREDFRRKSPDTAIVVEQIDGVIELGGTVHLVEMKWLNTAIGIGEFSPHLSRLFVRANANGIFIATNGYASSVLSECRTALSHKTLFLCSLHEIILLLQRQDDLITFLKRKSQAAIIDKNPFFEILS